MKRHKSVWASCPRKSSRGGVEAESPHPTKEELWVSRALCPHAADRVVQPSQEGINKPCTTHRGQEPAWVELSLCFRTGSFYWGKNPPLHHQLPKWLHLNNAVIQVGLKGIIIFFFFLPIKPRAKCWTSWVPVTISDWGKQKKLCWVDQIKGNIVIFSSSLNLHWPQSLRS